MQLKISHSTRYSYEQPVSYALQQIRLTPQDSANQKVLDWNVQIEGGQKELDFFDQYGNHTWLVQTNPGENGIAITASGTIETTDTAGILGHLYDAAPLWHFRQPTPLTQAGNGIRSLAKLISPDEGNVESLHDVSRAIIEQVPYKTGETFADTTAEAALTGGHGVCQDHAQIFIAAARHRGLPARYVSGYLMMNDRVDQEASHAWAEVYLHDLGWVGFDVSNRISPDARYVKLATGLDYRDCAPISGTRLGSGDESMIVSLQVQQ